MATVSRTKATLRISGDALDPSVITGLLGHAPTSSQMKGQHISTRVAKFGMWRLEAAPRTPGDLDAQVDEILSKLSQDLSVWASITSTYTADLFCGVFLSGSNEGLSLSVETLEALGARGVEIGLDIYSGDDDDS